MLYRIEPNVVNDWSTTLFALNGFLVHCIWPYSFHTRFKHYFFFKDLFEPPMFRYVDSLSYWSVCVFFALMWITTELPGLTGRLIPTDSLSIVFRTQRTIEEGVTGVDGLLLSLPNVDMNLYVIQGNSSCHFSVSFQHLCPSRLDEYT